MKDYAELYIENSYHKDWKHTDIFNKDIIKLPIELVEKFYTYTWVWESNHMSDPYVDNKWYLRRTWDGTRLHRWVAWQLGMISSLREEVEVYFINEDATDYRKENLGVRHDPKKS